MRGGGRQRGGEDEVEREFSCRNDGGQSIPLPKAHLLFFRSLMPSDAGRETPAESSASATVSSIFQSLGRFDSAHVIA